MKNKYLLLATMFAIVVGATNVYAGTGGSEFTEIYNLILGWTQGFLGKTLAVGAFLTGIAIGVVRQSLMAIALGIGAAMAVYYTPNIIDGIVTALL